MIAVMKPKGIYCPNCGSKKVVPESRSRPVPGVRFRYFKCSGCTGRFKTKEILVVPPPK